MYSEKIKKALQGISIGNEIKISLKSKSYEGKLMPSTELNNPNMIILKLKNGYNIGIKYSDEMKIQKLNSTKQQEKQKIHSKTKNKTSSLKPKVSIITTGGTITSKIDYETGGVTSLITPEELISSVPELNDTIEITDIIQPFNRMSESMSFKDYIELAKTIEKELQKTDAVIITHGTDTMHYTAAALSFMFHETRKPIILTGAQRSADRPSSDAFLNLIFSAKIAASDIGEVGICMHSSSSDDKGIFIRGTKARKMHTSKRNAFRPINDYPIAEVTQEGVKPLQEYKKSDKKSKPKALIGMEEKVALIKAHPNSDPEIIDFYMEKGYNGLIIEATGLGQIPLETKEQSKNWMPYVKKAIEKGMIICFAPQTIYGRLNPYVYSQAREYKQAGVIFLEDMLPETALIKLSWLLGTNQKNVKEKMLENYAGEITEKTKTGTFLY